MDVCPISKENPSKMRNSLNPCKIVQIRAKCVGFPCHLRRRTVKESILTWPHVGSRQRQAVSEGSQHSQGASQISPSPHHLSKSKTQPPFDSGCLIRSFLSHRDFLLFCHFHRQYSTSRFDMVAEQRPGSGRLHFATSLSFFCPIKSVTTTTVTTTRASTNQITSSSEEERPHWSSKLQEESDIKMLTNDPKLNPWFPSPT